MNRYIYWLFGITTFIIMFTKFNMLQNVKNNLLFHPVKEIRKYPTKFNNIYIPVEETLKINAWYFPTTQTSDNDIIILYFHGNAHNMSSRIQVMEFFQQNNIPAFMIDYLGYGYSDGLPSEQGCYISAEAAINYIINVLKYRSDKIIVFGVSLGGSIASYIASKYIIGGLIIQSSFTTIGHMAHHMFGGYIPQWICHLLCDEFNTIQYIKNRKGNSPVLVIHGKDDDIVPHYHGLEIHKTVTDHAPDDGAIIYFKEIPGDHNDDPLEHVKYQNMYLNFIKKCSQSSVICVD
jgi:fermentation-respiration switch protein FrsA (DUF1100 family)